MQPEMFAGSSHELNSYSFIFFLITNISINFTPTFTRSVVFSLCASHSQVIWFVFKVNATSFQVLVGTTSGLYTYFISYTFFRKYNTKLF